MITVWSLSGVVLGYLLLLFIVAFWGERRLTDGQQHPLLYSLGLGIHCTSWAFFGTTTQASDYGWAFIPTYLGMIIAMLFGFNLVKRIAALCQQHSISSLADFVGLRYRGSHLLSAIITLLCLFGVVPYIALQLEAVTKSFSLLAGTQASWLENVSLYVTLIMALFAVFFGTQSMNLAQKHPGLLLTVALSSLVKLMALLLVGLFVVYGMFDGLVDVFGQAYQSVRARETIAADGAPVVYISHVLLGICAMFCLPRQFHMTFVENNGEQELRTARWAFPAYLTAMTLVVLPLALAGHVTFTEGNINTDIYVLALPMSTDTPSVALIAFVGGLAAATAMIIVSTLSVGIMMSNNLVTPLWLKLQILTSKPHDLRPAVLMTIRRTTVLLVMGIAYVYHQDVSKGGPLFKSGILSMALLAQILPTLMGGLLLSKGNRPGAFVGLAVGAGFWFYGLLWPSITSSYYFNPPPTDEMLAQGFIVSLFANVVCYIACCLLFPDSSSRQPSEGISTPEITQQGVKVRHLLSLTARILPGENQQMLLTRVQDPNSDGFANAELLSEVESELAIQVGSASARIIIAAISEKHQGASSELVGLVEEASQTYQFNHEVLQSSVQHIQQGICVLDQQLCVLAWNERYLEMFDYPKGFICVGKPIKAILIFNAERGLLGDKKNIDREIEKRIALTRAGSEYKYVRRQTDGKVIELNGSPLPGGGFVTTYSDITEYMAIQQQLQESKEHLETRVEQRTEELRQANYALAEAKHDAEQANDSKTKFLAAAGHDLMQPFNAACLFASLLQQKANDQDLQQISVNLVQSLNNAEELLSMLLDMTKLESGKLTANVEDVRLSDILTPLANEFSVIARQKGLAFRYQPTQVRIRSDRRLLRRVIQNLLSNAIRYTRSGRVLLGVRKHKHHCRICVLDTGPGIAEQDRSLIFEEFAQLQSDNAKQGLGLGLTIVDRMSRLLGHDVHLHSQLGKGTCFDVQVPLSEDPATTPSTQSTTARPHTEQLLAGKRVLIVENEMQTRQAVEALFRSWGADVVSAQNSEDALPSIGSGVDFMLLDYHLDNNETGIDVAQRITEKLDRSVPGVLNSADRSDETRQRAADAGLHYLPKPLKPPALKRLIRQLLI